MEAQFTVNRAPTFAQTHNTISIFGVYKDGRLEPGSWLRFGSRISNALARESCETGFSERLRDEEPDLFTRAAAEARESGITPELLTEFAPRADGELILVLYVSGSTPEKASPRPAARPAAATGGLSRHGRAGRGRGMSPSNETRDDRALQLAWTLFSVKSHETVADLQMRYTGQNADEAVDLFVEKLKKTIPDSLCVGWKWKERDPEIVKDGSP
jgi:hypothetical protein